MIAFTSSLVFLLFNFVTITCYIVEPGPLVVATKGEVWPKPQEQTTEDKFYIVRPQIFKFKVLSESCDILTNALDRYINIIVNQILPKTRVKLQEDVLKPWKTNKNFVGYLDALDIILLEPCKHGELPDASMTEQYVLNITSDTVNVLSAQSVWGILRGLETFSQLLYPTADEALHINCTSIFDYPRYQHRGVLVDTSRHYIPVSKLLKTLDALSYNKLNVFHWHITDDQSFPYISKTYPELSQQGAYLPTYVYTQQDVAQIINYAAARGIRVIAEFDTPGHTRSWGQAFPELLSPCYRNNVSTGQYGPMDPTKNFTYEFMENLLTEIVDVFPDNFLHLGADEVEFECWQSNPEITAFMQTHNISSYVELESYYIQKIIDMSDKLKATSIVWEEVFTNGVQLPNRTIVHVWKGGWELTMNAVTNSGFQTLLSSCWYLDHLSGGGDWTKYYDCEPTKFKGSDEQKKLVIGGEACMWAEVVNEYNIESRMWPRASAAAEKLWSVKDADTSSQAGHRLEEHTCRMNKRGIGAQPPNGSGFCEL
ncbi:hypothetical protein RN001_001017 [Aquatica leii]|uniref:Beta-hexosaminidase n=1 Tax=Aquatica leii TaxID=1421715 RepID=A0AAN7SCI6_9COLE|nr:hypothetical protein RN001_001017 [Aquatica leii]